MGGLGKALGGLPIVGGLLGGGGGSGGGFNPMQPQGMSQGMSGLGGLLGGKGGGGMGGLGGLLGGKGGPGGLMGMLGGFGRQLGLPDPLGVFGQGGPFGGQQQPQGPPDWYSKPPDWWNQGPQQAAPQPAAPVLNSPNAAPRPGQPAGSVVDHVGSIMGDDVGAAYYGSPGGGGPTRQAAPGGAFSPAGATGPLSRAAPTGAFSQSMGPPRGGTGGMTSPFSMPKLPVGGTGMFGR